MGHELQNLIFSPIHFAECQSRALIDEDLMEKCFGNADVVQEDDLRSLDGPLHPLRASLDIVPAVCRPLVRGQGRPAQIYEEVRFEGLLVIVDIAQPR